ncbi:hypothetical protein HELRODRAFT_179232 [Helobdella robusta]|uniref:Uncharacterized protein n=1 Tax=Helobdella robusta TaxID=6412 RepID=T1FEE4_HELRO|nr:hypothetical protein HELRODRAFT_179232 [Helobdella robusta]ESN95464.1 hypothetical protein HELRODRAFT_179232 [Helobdella robusta]
MSQLMSDFVGEMFGGEPGGMGRTLLDVLRHHYMSPPGVFLKEEEEDEDDDHEDADDDAPSSSTSSSSSSSPSARVSRVRVIERRIRKMSGDFLTDALFAAPMFDWLKEFKSGHVRGHVFAYVTHGLDSYGWVFEILKVAERNARVLSKASTSIIYYKQKTHLLQVGKTTLATAIKRTLKEKYRKSYDDVALIFGDALSEGCCSPLQTNNFIKNGRYHEPLQSNHINYNINIKDINFISNNINANINNATDNYINYNVNNSNNSINNNLQTFSRDLISWWMNFVKYGKLIQNSNLTQKPYRASSITTLPNIFLLPISPPTKPSPTPTPALATLPSTSPSSSEYL